jgi:hypothetical protein
MRKIEAWIEEDGSITMDAIGFEGKGCHEALQELERKMASSRLSEKKKAEYYKQKVRVQAAHDKVTG